MKSLKETLAESLIVENYAYSTDLSLNQEQSNLIKLVEKNKLFSKFKKLGNIEKITIADYHPYSIENGLTFRIYLDTNIRYSKSFKLKKDGSYDVNSTQDSYGLKNSDGQFISGGFSSSTAAFELNSQNLDSLKFLSKGSLILPSDEECKKIDDLLCIMYDNYVMTKAASYDQTKVMQDSYTKDKVIYTDRLDFAVKRGSRTSPILKLYYNFVKKEVIVKFTKLVGGTSADWKSLAISVPIRKGTVYDNLLRISKDKKIFEKIAAPLHSSYNAHAKAFADFYKDWKNPD
jgi:hypothetical protein